MGGKTAYYQMSNSSYRQLLGEQPASYPLFHQPWWLDIACGGADKWLGLVSTEEYHGKQAVMPLPLLPKWKFLPTIRKPLLTPYLGPWWPDLPNLDNKGQFTLGDQLWPTLIDQFPRTVYFHQTFRPELSNGLPFHTAGFRHQSRYAFRIPAGRQDFNRNNRRSLQKAANLSITSTDDGGILWDLLHVSLQRQGLSVPFGRKLLDDLYLAAAARGQAVLWVCKDETGSPLAAIWVLWDTFTNYILSNGVSTDGRSAGAYARLVAEVITNPPQASLPIDLCGTMLPTVARMNVGFGAVQREVIEVVRFF
jgi:hypothetical protein